MKKEIIHSIAVATLVTLTLTVCDNSKPQVDKESEGATAAVPTDMKIAYVEVDSVMTQYKFCKGCSLILQKKGQNIQSTLAGKQKQLEQAVANFQQKLQRNAYTRDQTESIQAGLQKQSADLQALNQRLGNGFQTETDKCNKALRDSIQHFLASCNKDKKYSLILSKAGDNLLYADKSYDITKDVVAGLSKAYKPIDTKKKADAKK